MRQYRHVEPERLEILDLINRRFDNLRLLKRRSGYPERRLQRRVTELLALGWIEQTGMLTEPSVYLRVFSLTDEGLRNVPSRLRGSTVRG